MHMQALYNHSKCFFFETLDFLLNPIRFISSDSSLYLLLFCHAKTYWTHSMFIAKVSLDGGALGLDLFTTSLRPGGGRVCTSML